MTTSSTTLQNWYFSPKDRTTSDRYFMAENCANEAEAWAKLRDPMITKDSHVCAPATSPNGSQK